jgi:hypothetical protein
VTRKGGGLYLPQKTFRLKRRGFRPDCCDNAGHWSRRSRQFFRTNLSLTFKLYGAMRIRTADPLNAIEVLYQLSYNPVKTIAKCSLNKIILSIRKIFDNKKAIAHQNF